ncbi:MAG: hypothetical protein IJQ33_10455 [Clostridia bacterium]|nr:hypothetical protein [Clostridia bacterium]
MLEDILLQHFAQYPKMEPQDAVKLIYQQEFGPEHMIKDAAKSLAALKMEIAQLQSSGAKEPLYESIGNGLCRLNLRPCRDRNIPAEDVNRLFVETAQGMEGDKKRFRQGIRALQKLAEEGETPFDAVELDLFLARYPDSCPALHHSVTYRLAYAPAYRIVAQKKLKAYLAGRRNAAE